MCAFSLLWLVVNINYSLADDFSCALDLVNSSTKLYIVTRRMGTPHQCTQKSPDGKSVSFWFSTGVIKRQPDYLYDSVDLDVAKMQVGYGWMEYPQVRLFETSTSPIVK